MSLFSIGKSPEEFVIKNFVKDNLILPFPEVWNKKELKAAKKSIIGILSQAGLVMDIEARNRIDKKNADYLFIMEKPRSISGNIISEGLILLIPDIKLNGYCTLHQNRENSILSLQTTFPPIDSNKIIPNLVPTGAFNQGIFINKRKDWDDPIQGITYTITKIGQLPSDTKIVDYIKSKVSESNPY